MENVEVHTRYAATSVRANPPLEVQRRHRVGGEATFEVCGRRNCQEERRAREPLERVRDPGRLRRERTNAIVQGLDLRLGDVPELEDVLLDLLAISSTCASSFLTFSRAASLGDFGVRRS